MTRLFKTTITVWTMDSTSDLDLESLGKLSSKGEAVCTGWTIGTVREPEHDPDYNPAVDDAFQALYATAETDEGDDDDDSIPYEPSYCPFCSEGQAHSKQDHDTYVGAALMLRAMDRGDFKG